MDDITQSWSRLSLSEREGPGCNLTNEDQNSDYAIIAKFLTKRALNMEVIARTFNPLWRARNGFKIQNLGNHILLFTFDNQREVDRILSSEPWSFDKHLVVMQQYDKETPVSEVKFDRASFWVQLHGIPPRYMTVEAALKISNVVGEVERPKDFNEIDGGSFLRLKVKLDLSLPLCRGRLISLESGKQVWIGFKYERLPNICYWCGRLTHDDKDCDLWIESEGTLQSKDRQFGSGLRAPAFVMTRKQGLTVPSYYEARKKSVSSSSQVAMETETATQTTVNLRDTAEQGGLMRNQVTVDETGGNNDKGCNGNSGINEIKVVQSDLMKDSPNEKITVSKSQTVNDANHGASITADSHNGMRNKMHQNVSMHLNRVKDDEANRVSLEESSARASLSPTSNDQVNDPRDLQNTPRVPTPTTLRRVLSTWTRKVRAATPSTVAQCEQFVGKKRGAEAEGSQSHLPSKRQQVFHGDDDDFLELVEAVEQPHQPQ